MTSYALRVRDITSYSAVCLASFNLNNSKIDTRLMRNKGPVEPYRRSPSLQTTNMPPRASVFIPIRSPAPAHSLSSKGKAPLHPVHKPRLYGDDPLPIAPSQHAPHNCRISERFLDSQTCQVTYRLKVADLDFGEVGLDEILDFVSPLHLETFENGQFEEDQEAVEIAAEIERKKREARVVRRKERARTKGIVGYEVLEEGEESGDGGTGVIGEARREREEAAKRAGRARPTYKHLYKLPTERRRKRDLRTRELMPLSDEEVQVDEQSEGGESVDDGRPTPSGMALADPPKRRRRKRDPETGELLPLSPKLDEGTENRAFIGPEINSEKKKRPRRRRHPITNELMPLGWKYNPDRENANNSKPNPSLGDEVSDMRELGLGDPRVKRRRMRSPSTSVKRSRSPIVALPSSQARAAARDIIEIESSASVESEEEQQDNKLPQPFRRSVGGMVVGKTAVAKKREFLPSPEPEPRASQQSRNTMTSILHPISQQVDQSSESEDESDADPLQAFKKGIIAKKHPTSKLSSQISKPGQRTTISHPIASAAPTTANDHNQIITIDDDTPSSNDDDNDEENQEENEANEDSEDLEEGELHVEAILAHCLSDPRTHSTELGKEPVMLYKVKWEGWEQLMWEPASSFADPEVVGEYERRVGMRK